ncbi:MAG TPA: helix-turn-helix domain-containing protein [Pyrinomonadaceae bacterium]|jgi:transcriptional regulator with XRE-family HTH domain|nr:helix-turn-helix domain-containing protein [Pyrinomonadaceae bacterium]
MGHGRRQERPERLAEKLKAIRAKLGLSQIGMSAALERQGIKMRPSSIALYELGQRIPGLLTIGAYAKIAGISTDKLIYDELNLPAKYK